MHEITPSSKSSRRPWVTGFLFVVGLGLGIGLCKEFWPTVQVKEVTVVRYVDRQVEVPIDRIVEKVVEKQVEVPVIRDVIRYVEKPPEAKPVLVADGPTRYELEDWAKLRRNMKKDTVRVLVGDPIAVSGYGQEIWTFPFGGSAVFTSDGKLESWQVPGTSRR